MGLYAVIDNDKKVIEIVEFDVLSGEISPYPEFEKVRVGEPTDIEIPNVGKVWNGELNKFE